MKKKVKAGKMKGRSAKFKSKATYAVDKKQPNKDLYNKADDSIKQLTSMNGKSNKKYGWAK